MEKESVYGVREVLTWFSGAFSGGAADMGSGAIGFGRPWVNFPRHVWQLYWSVTVCLHVALIGLLHEIPFRTTSIV